MLTLLLFVLLPLCMFIAGGPFAVVLLFMYYFLGVVIAGVIMTSLTLYQFIMVKLWK